MRLFALVLVFVTATCAATPVVRTQIVMEDSEHWVCGTVIENDLRLAETLFGVKFQIMSVDIIGPDYTIESLMRRASVEDHYMTIYYLRDLYAPPPLPRFRVRGYAFLPHAQDYYGIFMNQALNEGFPKVLAHEIGHYYGLRHTFDPNDHGVPDIPKNIFEDENSYDWLYVNVMGYGDIDSKASVTPGQIEIVQRNLHHPNRRKHLLQKE